MKIRLFTTVLLALITLVTTAQEGSIMEERLLLDDFESQASALGTQWQGFTDRVMGGITDIDARIVQDDDGRYVRMSGDVSTANNGGFIQIRLELAGMFRSFDASGYEGVRLVARGLDSGYYVHIRTSNSRMPWMYFTAPVPVGEDWNEIFIPWESFRTGDYGNWGRLNTERLKSIALVAYGKDFEAQIDLLEIGLY